MSIKILLADDSITIQKVVGIIFGGEEYSLTVVDNGKAAIDKALDAAPDIMLIDALMPGISGYEVCETIRATPSLAKIPILLLTGSFEPFDEARAQTCGADDFLAKPFESQQILAKVHELYDLGASRTALTKQPEPQADTAPAATAEPFATAEPAETAEMVMAFDTNDIWNAFTPAPVEILEESQTQDTFAQSPYTIASSDVPSAENSEALSNNNLVDFTGTPSTTAESLPATVTEEQLRTAIAAVSRDVIEKIVWELVPDMAETLIKEAIARITGENGNIHQGDKN